MVLETVASFGLNGQEVQARLEAAGITLNKNAIPDDPLPPFKPSGVRLGTPSATTRGMKEPEMIRIAQWIVAICKDNADPAAIGKEVRQLCLEFPSPSGLVETA